MRVGSDAVGEELVVGRGRFDGFFGDFSDFFGFLDFAKPCGDGGDGLRVGEAGGLGGDGFEGFENGDGMLAEDFHRAGALGYKLDALAAEQAVIWEIEE